MSRKARFDLLPWRALTAVARVLAFGADKYPPAHWRTVSDDDHFAAAMRHLSAWWLRDYDDAESGESHLAHALARVAFLLEREEAGR